MKVSKKYPLHPGQALVKHFLKPLELDKYTFAKFIGWEMREVTAFTASTLAITPQMAHDLGDAFQTEPNYWLRLQREWDAWQKRIKISKIKKQQVA
jgi:antitoxin HigA-1